MNKCYCGSEQEYEKCCGKFHNESEKAKTAEELMRSRYSAFCRRDVDYLIKTHDSNTRSRTLRSELEQCIELTDWSGLEIVETERGTTSDKQGMVHFIARYRENDIVGKIEEISEFTKKKGKWFYSKGEIL